MKLHLAQINPTIGDFKGNQEKIFRAMDKAREEKSDLLLFSELVISGYPPEDFLLHREFQGQVERVLQNVIAYSDNLSLIIGVTRQNIHAEEKKLHNSAAVISNGALLGFQDKTLLPTYDVFDERRYFEPGSCFSLFTIGGKKVAVTICEDLWEHAGLPSTQYRIDPVEELKKLKPDLLVNLSASPYHFGKYENRVEVVRKAALSLNCPVALCNQVGGNDSLIFDGYSLIVNEKGELIARGKGFEEDLFSESSSIITPPDPWDDLHKALVMGIRDYFYKSGFKKACLGLSGGIDSALVACLAKDALGKENVLAVLMPSRYSSEGSFKDAHELAKNLEIETLTLSIESPFKSYLQLLEPAFKGKQPDITEENLQARIRGTLLMSLSNKHGYLVLSTGNKSEMAMGYSTLYGDLAGGLAVISDLTKEKVYALSKRIPQIPLAIIEKPPSAELKPDQKDIDSLPPYPIVDKVLESYVEKNESAEEIALKNHFDLDLVKSLIRKIHYSEYKRRQAPPGLRVSEKAFSVGRRFPIVQRWV